MPTTVENATTAERVALPEVLTSAEAAEYLRVSEEALLRAVAPGGVPTRLIDGQWRFLKSALQEWLAAEPKPSSREALLSVAGAWKDDSPSTRCSRRFTDSADGR